MHSYFTVYLYKLKKSWRHTVETIYLYIYTIYHLSSTYLCIYVYVYMYVFIHMRSDNY